MQSQALLLTLGVFIPHILKSGKLHVHGHCKFSVVFRQRAPSSVRFAFFGNGWSSRHRGLSHCRHFRVACSPVTAWKLVLLNSPTTSIFSNLITLVFFIFHDSSAAPDPAGCSFLEIYFVCDVSRAFCCFSDLFSSVSLAGSFSLAGISSVGSVLRPHPEI